MKYIIKTTAMALIGGLFTAGMALAAAETKEGITTEGQQQGQHQQQQLTAVPMDGKQVRELQSALNEKGYEVGAVDGIVGPKTMGAIRDFQSKEGLTATGQPDQQTLKALGIDVGQQEFMGVSPEFGEEQQLYQPETMPMEPMERTEQMPMQQMDQQPSSPDVRKYQ